MTLQHVSPVALREQAVARAAVRRRPLSRVLLTGGIYTVLLGWLLFNVVPFLWTVGTSFKQVKDAFSIPPKFLFTPTLDAYANLWQKQRFGDFLINSLVVTAATIAISLSIGCLAGYALARFSSKIGFALLAVSLIFRALPRISFLLPFFTFARATGLYDTRIVLVMVFVAVNQPFAIWMLRSFFAEIPIEIEEATMVDGCSRLRAFVSVIMPLMLPGIITTGIFTTLLAYNEFLMPAILTTSKSATLPVAIATIGTDDLKYWNVTAAGSVSIALPLIAVVLFAQRFIVRGLTFGALKG